MLGELRAETRNQEIYALRDLPPADELSHDDAVFIVQHRLGQIELEDRAGRYFINASNGDPNASEEQMRAALKLLVSSYGVDVGSVTIRE